MMMQGDRRAITAVFLIFVFALDSSLSALPRHLHHVATLVITAGEETQADSTLDLRRYMAGRVIEVYHRDWLVAAGIVTGFILIGAFVSAMGAG
jgi:hypothetical protein